MFIFNLKLNSKKIIWLRHHFILLYLPYYFEFFLSKISQKDKDMLTKMFKKGLLADHSQETQN